MERLEYDRCGGPELAHLAAFMLPEPQADEVLVRVAAASINPLDLGNAGQDCTASKRFIVLEAVADDFLEKFKAALAQLKPGDPMDEHSTLAPLSSVEALDKLEQQVQTAVQHGAKLLLGGQRVTGLQAGTKGNFMQPTILTDIAENNPMFSEEFFGPVALFFRVPDEAAAVALANNSPFVQDNIA